MFTTLVGCVQGPSAEYTHANRAATALDFAGFVTMFVLGALALTSTGNLSIGSTGAGILLGAGLIGFIILANKNVKPAWQVKVEKIDTYTEKYI